MKPALPDRINQITKVGNMTKLFTKITQVSLKKKKSNTE